MAGTLRHVVAAAAAVTGAAGAAKFSNVKMRTPKARNMQFSSVSLQLQTKNIFSTISTNSSRFCSCVFFCALFRLHSSKFYDSLKGYVFYWCSLTGWLAGRAIRRGEKEKNTNWSFVHLALDVFGTPHTHTHTHRRKLFGRRATAQIQVSKLPLSHIRM